MILKLTLLENSHSFLSEALSKALVSETDPHQWKFAIFNICQAIEISLKERLGREHPCLIFDNIDRRTRTVSPKLAVSRLIQVCGVNLSDTDISMIKRATDWRNQIVHSDFSLDVMELKAAFSRLLGFLSLFHGSVLQESLADVVPRPLWDEAIKIRDYGQELFNRASERIQEEEVAECDVVSCPVCAWKCCVFLDDICRCYVCGSEEKLVECEDCNRYVPESQSAIVPINEEEDACICRDCLDGAEDLPMDYILGR